jgi:hypothetical protein
LTSFKPFSFSRRNLLHGVSKNLSYVSYVDLKTMTDCKSAMQVTQAGYLHVSVAKPLS